MARIKKTMTIGDTYSRYLKDTPEENQVDKLSYVALCRAYNRLMMEKVLKGERVVLPVKLGTIEVKGFKDKLAFEGGLITGLSPNWKDTKELWDNDPQSKIDGKIIYNTNEHSSGIRYKFLWSKKNCNTKNKTSYTLRINRPAKRALSSMIFEGKEYHSK